MMRNLSTAGKFLLLPVFVGLAVMLAVSLHGLFASPRLENGGGSPESAVHRPAASRDQGVTDAMPGTTSSPQKEQAGTVRMPDAAAPPDLLQEQADEMAALMRTLRDNPNDADNLYKIAEIFVRAGDQARAEIFLNRALLSRPADVRARVMLGNILFKQNKMREAAAAYEELLKISEDADTLYNLAVLRKYHLNDKAGAEALLRRLLRLNDAPPETLEKARKELQ
ncbi:MAG: tetratricopeptide repeat protein [Desulfovibrio sp.]|jgi:cytochrome c-type biogenesis protein CcmH/NrfG|nr:tetratricopeptide repeat protein [Desulfovibrio sp.]